MSTYQDMLKEGTGRLAESRSETPRLDAEVLLRHLTGLDRAGLFLRLPDPAPESLYSPFRALIERRIAGESIAYIVGSREFMGMRFQVGPGVLVPRPETELLVEWALNLLNSGMHGPVVDVGTGSGAIAVSVTALVASPVNVIATDVSAQALDIAGNNAEALLDANRRALLKFRQGSLFQPILEPVALVLANLPYLTPGQIDGNSDLEAEPRLALDGGTDGLDLVRALIADLPRVLATGGAVGLELDPTQTATVEHLLRKRFPDRTVHTIHDLAGLGRHVVLEPVHTKSG